MAPKVDKKETAKPGQDKKDDKAKDAKDKKDDKAKDAKDKKDDKAKDKKDDKAKDKKDDKAKDKKESLFKRKKEQIKEFLHRPVAFLIACITVLIIYVIAFIFLPLAFREWHRTANLRQATEMVKDYMMAKNPAFLEMSDVDLVLEAHKVATVLAKIARTLDEIDVDIEDTRYKLNHDWTAFQGTIYYFEIQRMNWNDAKEFCANFNATMLKIDNEAEQEWIVDALKTRDVHYWLGIEKRGWDMVWVEDDTPVDTFYWSGGKPEIDRFGSPNNPVCYMVTSKCWEGLNCWRATDCELGLRYNYRPLCELKPKKRWLDNEP